MSQSQTENKTEFSIHPATGIGRVALTVANLENQIQFYEKTLGFKLHWKKEKQAGLGAGGADLLVLVEEPNLKKYRGVTGLYHFAVLFPNRRELAIAVARLFALKVRNFPTDHIMTKTTYLADPEGNGIELYCESPEDGAWTLKDGKYETRRADGSWSDGREPLDVDALFKHLREDDRISDSTPDRESARRLLCPMRRVCAISLWTSRISPRWMMWLPEWKKRAFPITKQRMDCSFTTRPKMGWSCGQ